MPTITDNELGLISFNHEEKIKMLRFFCTCALFILLTTPSLAQNKPIWLTNLEKVFTEKERASKIDHKTERYDSGGFDYSLALKTGQNTSLIQIMRLNNLTNAEETFAGQALIFSNTMGKGFTKSALKNFGDEGILWTERKTGSVKIDFRKKDIFVHIFTTSETTAKRFAGYILEQLSGN